MKDYTEVELCSGRPDGEPEEIITYCLCCLFQDKKHELHTNVVSELTFEELIGALLVAKDLAQKSV